jgi:hypothetical protein
MVVRTVVSMSTLPVITWDIVVVVPIAVAVVTKVIVTSEKFGRVTVVTMPVSIDSVVRNVLVDSVMRVSKETVARVVDLRVSVVSVVTGMNW